MYTFSSFLQIIIWSVIPAIKYSSSEHGNDMLLLVALFQYILRLYLIFSLNDKIVKITGVFAKTAWHGAAYNLLLYMIASHVCFIISFFWNLSYYFWMVLPFFSALLSYSGISNHAVLFFQVLGALWYLLSVDRQIACWRNFCDETDCHTRYLYCDVKPDSMWNGTSVFSTCNAKNSTKFDFGMFQPLLANKTPNESFLKKYIYCLWWGLQNLRYDLLNTCSFMTVNFSKKKKALL
jgi:cyclic nucleotide gated channel, plant